MNEESACCGNCAFLIDGKCAHGVNGRNMCGEYIRKSNIHTKEWVAEYISNKKIIDAGINYQMSKRPIVIFGDAFSEFARELNRNKAFEDGAKWMQKQLDADIDSIELTGYKRGCEDTIEKACEAFCTARTCHVPRITCQRLGTCDDYDRFKKMLEE